MKRIPLLLSLFALTACGGTSSASGLSVSQSASGLSVSQSSSASSAATVEITDAVGRKFNVVPGSYKRIVCIGAGALRLYTYIGGSANLAGVEDIDNESLSTRPKMFDGVARPYMLAYGEDFKKLPSCGVGGPNAQAAEAEKILSCNPDFIVSEYEDADKSNALAQQVGVPVLTLSMGNDEKMFASLRNLGKVLDKDDRAEDLVAYYATSLAEIAEKTEHVSESEQKKTYICGLGNWGTTDQYMTAQNYAPFNIAHIKNVVSGLAKDGIQKIDAEKFEALAPEMEVMIFDVAAIKNIKGKGYDFSACAAFQTGEVYLQMAYNAYYTNFETSLINTYYMAAISYPERFPRFSIEDKANEITLKFNGKALYDDIKAKPQSFGGYQKVANPTEFFA